MAEVESIHRYLNKRNREWLMEKQNELIKQLDEFGVLVNRPHEMKVEQLELLVSCHRRTIEVEPDFVPKTLDVVGEVKVNKAEVVELVEELGWDTKQAIKHQTRKEERKIRNRKRVQLLREINRLEVLGELDKAEVLGKMLVNL